MKKITFIALLYCLWPVLALVGCTGRSEQPAGGPSHLEALVQQADSLIDLAPDSTLRLCSRFFEAQPSTADTLYARVKLIEGNAHLSLGDLEEARRSMDEARRLAGQTGDLYVLINATADLGVVLRVGQKPDSALALYNEALSFIPPQGFADEKVHLLTSVAILYANTGRLDEAAEYAGKAVESARNIGNMEVYMYATSQAGAIYNLVGRRAEAYRLTHAAMAQAARLGLPRYSLKAVGHLMDMHLRDGNIDSVMHYLRQGEELARQFPVESVEGLGFLEEKYVVLAALGRYEESLEVQRRLLRLPSSAATFMPADKLHLRMARNYVALRRTDEAVAAYERAFSLADSLRGAEADRQLSEFYARFKTAEKELALVAMERRQARTNMWLAVWAAIALLLAVLFGGTILYVRLRRRKEAVRLLQSRIAGIEQERGRLAKDLHDGICNDLYGIELLMQTATPPEKLLEEVEQIRSDVRRISHELMPPALQDVDLPRALEGMIGKLRHAYPDKTFRLCAEPDGGWEAVPADVTYGLYRVCQELLGNTLRHARPTEVEIRLSRNERCLRLALTHNGAEPAHTDAKGLGTLSVRERLDALGATAEGLPFARRVAITCPFR